MLHLLGSAARDLDDAERNIRSAESYNDASYIHSLLSRARREVEDAKRDIGDAETLVKRSWGQ